MFGSSLDGEVFRPGSPGYEAVRRPVNPAFGDVRPRLVVRCRSVRDVVATLAHARATGDHLAIRGGGHCFAGRSSTDGIVLDLSALDDVTVAGVATVGAGARLARVYSALHAHGCTLPAGCGAGVGIAGLTLGGGIGLLGREHGLTCDRLIGAQAVLADGSVVECDDEREPDLFWALRGAGGGQFGVVTSLRFDPVAEPAMTRVEGHPAGAGLAELVSAWQAWAPDAPDGLTVNLTLTSSAGSPVVARLFGASTFGEGRTSALLRCFPAVELRGGLTVPELKRTFAEPPQARTVRIRSEFFARSLPDRTLAELLAGLGEPRTSGRRELTFTAMGGAYNRIASGATAFAHRSERFLLEHLADAGDPWVDRSWAVAHTGGSGHVYPNFPDPALADEPPAYHAGNLARLTAVKRAYDPHGFFAVPQVSERTEEK
ncbi:FAD-binding oxidoreductase [Amycolatopsis sp. FDAARGOS 1241]|uniref:FAD-binding oxidoreductase n=1 Tax=Amycolatopsis sp. FDAARGOS 1241 TaxID=2778070 RepID=UPI00194DB081|nr:FAD-binding oxidoreductase [Amycolatopsis sp. FDAARGOS 1241]QRP43778.1 FAD-binding oxidoreductase [Amycolatopsis sp. FDAARGOS 1241]